MQQGLNWVLVLSAALFAVAGCTGATVPLEIATTTGIVNSGLLDEILPIFQRQSGMSVRIRSASSAGALDLLRDGVVDLVISRAPHIEAAYLDTRRDWVYAKIASNQFVVVGPGSDPAGVRGAANAIEAF